MANMTDADAVFADLEGTVLIGSDRRRDGRLALGGLRLPGWSAVVVELGQPASPIDHARPPDR